jgi:plastocyanin
MDGNFFFVVGIVLVICAVALAFLGIRESDRFPTSRAMAVGGVVLFAAVVATTMAFAVVKSKDEQDKRNEELAKEDQQQAENAGQTAPPASSPGGQPQQAGSSGTTLEISTPSGTALAYNQKQVSAPAGDVTIDFQNNEPLEHDVAVADSSGKVLGKTDLVTSGSASTSINLPAGTYAFYCTVPGHREAGMLGSLIATGGPAKPAAGGAKKK